MVVTEGVKDMCNLALGQTIFSDRIHKVNNNHASLSLNCANNFFGIKEKSQFIFHTQTLEFQRFKRHSSNEKKMYKAQFSRLNFKTSRLLFLSPSPNIDGSLSNVRSPCLIVEPESM